MTSLLPQSVRHTRKLHSFPGKQLFLSKGDTGERKLSDVHLYIEMVNMQTFRLLCQMKEEAYANHFTLQPFEIARFWLFFPVGFRCSLLVCFSLLSMLYKHMLCLESILIHGFSSNIYLQKST